MKEYLTSFRVPNYVLDEDLKGLAKLILMTMFYFENKYIGESRSTLKSDWFNVNNEEFCRIAGISEPTFRKHRGLLKKRGWIQFMPGYTGVNTRYQILTDKFYLAERYVG